MREGVAAAAAPKLRGSHAGRRLGSSVATVRCSRSLSHASALRARAAQICSPSRLAIECLLLILLVSWALNLYTWTFPAAACAIGRGSPAVQEYRPPICALRAFNGNYWTVETDARSGRTLLRLAALAPDAGTPDQLAFHLEQSDGEWFCLRWMATMHLVEVVPPEADSLGAAGGGMPHTLQLGRRNHSCRSDHQRFALRGHSIYSKGAASFINTRDHRELRAHGDVGPPWRPLASETLRSRVQCEALGGATALAQKYAELLREVEAGAAAPRKDYFEERARRVPL